MVSLGWIISLYGTWCMRNFRDSNGISGRSLTHNRADRQLENDVTRYVAYRNMMRKQR